jgi:Xaa-Pro aminopeptidase
MYKARQKAAAEAARQLGADALLVNGLVSIRYLTGFTGSEATLVITGDTPLLLCDSRYTLQATAETSGCRVVEYKVKLDGIATVIRDSGCLRVAFDADKTVVSFFNRLTGLLADIEFVPLADQLEHLRAVKTADEVQSVENSAKLASAAFVELLPMIKAGVPERILAVELEVLMKRSGAENKAFDFIVASGERGALPHGAPSDKLINSGELVTFDFGACLGGYNSDETVTVAVGSPEKLLLEIYSIVKDAHDMAIAAIRPGAECRVVDAVARDYIGSCGYGERFGHGLGHGVGLEVHEKPVLSPRSEDVLAEGMIVTIEPGIYLPGVGGVRVESLLLVTGQGSRRLGGIDKQLVFC